MTTITAPPTISQRDQQMVDRYINGETLAAIGADFDVSRERVRQIVSKLGGSVAHESRANRTAVREAEEAAAGAKFMARYGQVANNIAEQRYTRGECLARLRLLYPDVDLKLAEEALRDSHIVFRQGSEEYFSTAVIQAGLWYLIGAELGLAPDFEYAAVHVDLQLMEELSETVLGGEASSGDVATILGVIGAGKKYVADNPETGITGARYQELRNELVTTLGWVSKQGAMLWPPTRQTLQSRFGSWNKAMEAMGLASNPKGRSMGLLKFVDEDYQDAIQDFSYECELDEVSVTVARYDEWVKEQASTGQARPCGASLRNYFGGWSDAVRSVTTGH